MEQFKSYAAKRIAAGLVIAVTILLGSYIAIGLYHRPTAPDVDVKKPGTILPSTEVSKIEVKPDEPAKQDAAPAETVVSKKPESPKPSAEIPSPAPPAPSVSPKPAGVLFVEAVIQPMAYELNERFWRWRPNDIINITDNVNNSQLGVLEVTRRTAMALAERLSRTGNTASFDPNLERAMNWFMITADRYWFPSAESKYREGLKELAVYKDKLEKRKATFFTRPDNLIPLLAAYRDLLGSCDENLVKVKEEDGTQVSFFKADDYFYYSRGVASAMGTILEAILSDFRQTLESRHGIEPLGQAIESCRRAAQIRPWIITDGSLSSIFANHRANMAAPISHARFYLSVLIRTLST